MVVGRRVRERTAGADPGREEDLEFGTLAEADSDDATIQAQRHLHEMIAAEPRVSATTIQTVGIKGYDGFTLALLTS